MRGPWITLGLLVAALSGASGAEVSTTVYVGRHFEVRDPDQPVKYVLNHDTRVARITGSLSANERIQRVRLHTGWNLISLAVTASDFLAQIQSFNAGNGQGPLLRSGYRWRTFSTDYIAIAPGETLAAGSILWLQARTNGVIALQGEYAPATAPTVGTDGAFVSGPGLEAWSVQLPAGVTIWKLDAATGNWQAGLAGDLAPLSNLSREIAPGEAIYVHSPEAITLSVPRPELRVTYYHPDHLASTSVVTDSAGEVVEETAYHPFGGPRHQSRPGGIDSNYGFTQKERDRESRLHYFEARYLAGSLARFLSFDPLVQRLEVLEGDELKNLLVQPGKLNPFAYALNNPVRYNDPDGRDARPRVSERRPEVREQEPEPEITIRIGPVAKGSKELSAFSLSIIPQRGGVATPSNFGAGAGKAGPPSIGISRKSDAASTGLFKKSNEGTHIKSLVVIVPGKDGEYKIRMKDVIIESLSMHPNGTEDGPAETFALNAGSLDFEGPPSLSPAPAPNRETFRTWAIEPRNGQ